MTTAQHYELIVIGASSVNPNQIISGLSCSYVVLAVVMTRLRSRSQGSGIDGG